MFIYITGYNAVDAHTLERETFVVKQERIVNISKVIEKDKGGEWFFCVETPEQVIYSTPQETKEAVERQQVRLLILLNALELLYKRAEHADDISRLFVEMQLPTDDGKVETYRMELTSTVTLEI